MNVAQVLKDVESFISKLPEDSALDLSLNNVDDNQIINYGKTKDVYYSQPTTDLPYHWCVLEGKNYRLVLRGNRKQVKLIY